MSATQFDLLCPLPPGPPPGCCDPPPRPPAAPIRPFNGPGLTAIRYRIGTFTTFRRAMLDDLAEAAAAGRTSAAGPPYPFALWREGAEGDYQTLFIELWAYLGDILTFYQERIANEAFLPTATQRDSLLRLVRTIGYRPAPGAGASALLAFTVEKNKTITIPASFRAGSKPTPGVEPAVFETEDALLARGAHSAIPLSSVAPTNQFAPLAHYGALVSAVTTVNAGLASLAASTIYGAAGAAYLPSVLSSQFLQAAVASVPAAVTAATVTETDAEAKVASAAFIAASPTLEFALSPSVRFSDRFFVVARATRPIVLRGTSTRLTVGDYVVVENETVDGKTAPGLRRIDTVTPDKATNTTTITWRETAGTTYPTDKPVALYALRVEAAPFGSNAPDWRTLPSTLTNSDGKHAGAPYPNNWDDPANAASKVPAGSALLLDGVYDDARGTPDNPGWAVLRAGDGTARIFRVTGARAVSSTAYALNSRVTQITLDASVPAATFPLRDTAVLTGSEPLTLENNLPLPEPLAGNTLVLSGVYPDLQTGQTVILRGNPFDLAANSAEETVSAESGILAGPPIPDAANNITTVTLTNPLSQPYARAGAVLLANIAEATQGETVRDEILGSGNGGAFQSFPLRKKPLTYLPASDPEGLSAVQSTLQVTVNGVLWTEKPTLLESAPDDQDYTTERDDTEQTTVVFGDGFFGARPPTGRDNLRARYRKGIGTSGNVDADAVVQLLDSLPGLQKVTNPAPTLGGADAEQIENIRTNAPASIRTFGRAVSAADYAALALSYPGVAKASAAWVLRDPVTLKAFANPYVQLTVATTDGQPLDAQTPFARDLRAFLDRRRDPNVPLRLATFTPVYLDVAAEIAVDDRSPRQATVDAARAALADFFAFERLGFGQGIHLSAVYAALQAAPGVRAATVITLRRPAADPDPATVHSSILLRPTELAVIANDPTDPARGTLTVTWREGGFLDS